MPREIPSVPSSSRSSHRTVNKRHNNNYHYRFCDCNLLILSLLYIFLLVVPISHCLNSVGRPKSVDDHHTPVQSDITVVGYGQPCTRNDVSNSINIKSLICDESKSLYCSEENFCLCGPGSGFIYVKQLDKCVDVHNTKNDGNGLGVVPQLDQITLFQGIAVSSWNPGYLNKAEFHKFLQNTAKVHVSQLEANILYKFADHNKDGKISFKEWKEDVSKHENEILNDFELLVDTKGSLCIYEDDLEFYSDNVEMDFSFLDENDDDCFSLNEFIGFRNFYKFEDIPLYPTSAGTDVDMDTEQDDDEHVSSNAVYAHDVKEFKEREAEILHELFLELFTSKFKKNEQLNFEDVTTLIIKANFRLADIDNDGFISKVELQDNIRNFHASLNPALASSFLNRLDINSDGSVIFEEVLVMLTDMNSVHSSIHDEDSDFLNWLTTTFEAVENPTELLKLTEEITKMIVNEVSDIENDPEQEPEMEIKHSYVFYLFDTDRDNQLGVNELMSILRMKNEFLLSEIASNSLHVADEDGDGKVSFSEFLQLVTRGLRAQGINDDDVLVIKEEDGDEVDDNDTVKAINVTVEGLYTFQEMDYNEDGFVTKSELQKQLVDLNKVGSDEDIQASFNEYDKNKDGVLTSEDFDGNSFVLDLFKREFDGPIQFEEFRKTIQTFKGPKAEDVHDILDTWDLEEDGFLSLSEFQGFVFEKELEDQSTFADWIDILLQSSPDAFAEDIEAEFEVFDCIEPDGTITNDEFITCFEEEFLHNSAHWKYRNTGNMLFQQMDMNRNSQLSPAEFKIFMLQLKA